MNEGSNKKYESGLDKSLDAKIVRNDWLHLTNWIKSTESKKVRWQILLYFLLFLVFVSTPVILPLINIKFSDFAQFFAVMVTIPILLGVIPIVPFLLTSLLLELWMNEKAKISRFNSFSERQNACFIQSRLIIPLALTLLIDIVLILIMLIFGINYQISHFFYEKFGSSLNLFSLGLFLMSAFIISIFSIILLNYQIINHCNYLHHELPRISKIRPTNMPQEVFENVQDIQYNYFDIKGMKGLLLNYPYYLIVIISYFPILMFLYYPSFKLEGTAIFFWTCMWNIIFILSSLLIWKRTPNLLQNIPKSKYTLPKEVADYFSTDREINM